MGPEAAVWHCAGWRGERMSLKTRALEIDLFIQFSIYVIIIICSRHRRVAWGAQRYRLYGT